MRLTFNKHSLLLIDVQLLFLFLRFSVKLIFVNQLNFDLNLILGVSDQFNFILKLLDPFFQWQKHFFGLIKLLGVKFLFGLMTVTQYLNLLF